MGNLKGTGFKSEILYIKKRFGEEMQDRIVSTLPPEDQKLLKGAILLDRWYPAAVLERYRQAVVAQFKDEGLAIMEAMGQNSADFALTTIYRVFLSLTSPMFIIKRANSLWPRYFDTGRVEVAENGKTDVTVRIRDWEDASLTLCALMKGYFAKTMELSGGRMVQVKKLSCLSKGAPCCEYRVTWV